MSNQEDYQSQLPFFSVIPEKDLKSPNMPVDAYLQEAENLHHWATEDEAGLTGAGLDAALIQALSTRAGALREAESLWFRERFTREEAERAWREQSVAGYGLRDQLLHSFRFAFRQADDLLNRVSAIADGNGHADMIQDLNDLAVLGRENTERLESINLDLGLLDQAAEMADTLSALLARATTDREDSNRNRVLRDQAYTWLKQAVDEVRAAGQYVFWRNRERLKGYSSRYHRRARNPRATESSDTAAVVST